MLNPLFSSACSALAFDRPKLAKVPELPYMVLPFVKVFKHYHLCLAFEAVIAIAGA